MIITTEKKSYLDVQKRCINVPKFLTDHFCVIFKSEVITLKQAIEEENGNINYENEIIESDDLKKRVIYQYQL